MGFVFAASQSDCVFVTCSSGINGINHNYFKLNLLPSQMSSRSEIETMLQEARNAKMNNQPEESVKK